MKIFISQLLDDGKAYVPFFSQWIWLLNTVIEAIFSCNSRYSKNSTSLTKPLEIPSNFYIFSFLLIACHFSQNTTSHIFKSSPPSFLHGSLDSLSDNSWFCASYSFILILPIFFQLYFFLLFSNALERLEILRSPSPCPCYYIILSFLA